MIPSGAAASDLRPARFIRVPSKIHAGCFHASIDLEKEASLCYNRAEPPHGEDQRGGAFHGNSPLPCEPSRRMLQPRLFVRALPFARSCGPRRVGAGRPARGNDVLPRRAPDGSEHHLCAARRNAVLHRGRRSDLERQARLSGRCLEDSYRSSESRRHVCPDVRRASQVDRRGRDMESDSVVGRVLRLRPELSGKTLHRKLRNREEKRRRRRDVD